MPIAPSSSARTISTRHPGDARAKVLLVRVHIERGEWNDAYRIASRAASAHPADVDVLYYLGLVTRRLAADEFQRLVRMAPDSARVHQLQAEMLEAQERRADAEKEYAAALAARPDLLEALLGLAKLKRIRLACEEAIGLYDKAEAIRPTFDGAYGLGVCHSYLQNDEQAVKKFEQAVQRDAVGGRGMGRPRHIARQAPAHGRGHREAAARHRARAGDVRSALHARHGVPGVGGSGARAGGVQESRAVAGRTVGAMNVIDPSKPRNVASA